MNYIIFVKVRLSDLLYIPKGTSEKRGYLNKIQSKHIDFVICDNVNIKPILAIELDDSSYKYSDTMMRDNFKEEALNSANLALLRVHAQYNYNVAELIQRIKDKINKDVTNSASYDQIEAK